MVLETSEQRLVVCNNQVLTNPEQSIMQEDPLPCDHEEAYSEIFLQAHEVLDNVFSIVIWTVETDALI